MLTGHRMSGRGRRLVALALAGLVFAAAGAPQPADAAAADTLQERLMAETLLAQDVTMGKGVTVAVLSSGVDPHVRPRSGALRPGTDLVGLPHPKRVEGTLIASFLGGSRSSSGVPGVAPAADILPVRVEPDRDDHGGKDWWGRNNLCDVITRGIRYAVDHGAGVVLVATACYAYDTEQMDAALDRARSRNVVVVAPNRPTVYGDPPPLPAALPGVIGVGTLAKDGSRWSRYALKTSVTLVSAPGTRTPTTGPDGRPWEFWGPEPAAAWVAGTVALVRSKFPQLSPAQVAQVVADSAHHPKGGYNADLGFGVVSPVRALIAAEKIRRQRVSPTAPGVADDAHFAARPGTIGAARHDPALLAGLGGLILVSVGALVAAVFRLRAGRRGTKATASYPWTSTT
ncbi:S8 family serine peptidase [Actinoallomurus sp. NPDC052274]|uniref:S8 family serine peptidase n=1 Tax=Actinoallomurus sp. NPDC052274 TaxID=3155420 RepID=UPI0034304414